MIDIKKSNSPFKWIFICTFLSIFIHKSVILFITKLSNIQFFIVKATIYSSSPSFSSSLYHPNILIKFIIISISLLLLHKVYKKTTDSIYQKLYLVFCLFFSIILVFFNVSVIANRLLLNLSILLPLLFSRSLYVFKDKTKAYVSIFF